jgi:WD40 repeat protein/tetratricopeptide (TPR) repeat protein
MTSAAPAKRDQYDAFVSYSRTDVAFARLLEKTLNTYRPPKTLNLPQRRLRVFRDEGDLTGTDYFKAIDSYLERSSKLIVICSPAARASAYVDDEVRRYLSHHGSGHVIPVLLSGLPNNEATIEQIEQKAFPQAICEAMTMPLAVNYRGFDPAREKVDRGSFEGSWYTLLANLYERSRDEIEQRDRVRRKQRRNVLVATGLAVIGSLASFAAVAYWQKLQAGVERNAALRGQSAYLASVANEFLPDEPQNALLLAVEAVRTTRDVDGTITLEAKNALRRALASASGETLGGRGGRVRSSWFSADGSRAVTVEDDGRLDIWDLTAPYTPMQSIPADSTVRKVVALSANGKWMALSLGKTSEIVLWNVSTPITSATNLMERAGSGARFLGFSASNQQFATVDSDAVLRLWQLGDLVSPPVSLSGHKPKRNARAGPMTVVQAVFEPTSQWLFSTGWDNTARMWNLRDRDAPAQVLIDADAHAQGHFSADGKWFAQAISTNSDRRSARIGLWRLDKNRWEPVLPTDAVTGDEAKSSLKVAVVGFVTDPPGLVTLHDNQVRLWNLSADVPSYREFAGRAAVLAREGKQLAIVSAQAAGSTDRPVETVSIVDPADPARAPKIVASLYSPLTEMRFDLHARHLAIITERGSTDRGSIHLIALNGREPVSQVMRGTDRAGAEVYFSSDGKWLLATAKWGDFSVRMWQVENSSSDPVLVDAAALELSYKTRTGGGGGQPVGGLPDAIAVDPRGRWLAVPGPQQLALLIDLTNPAAAPRVFDGHTHAVTAAAFGPDGKWLATADWNHTVRIWDLNEPERAPVKLEPPPNDTESSVSAITVSPDGEFIATGGSDGKVALWKVAEPKVNPRMLDGHSGWITNLAFVPDGKQLLSAGDDGKLNVWRINERSGDKPVLIGAHSSAIIRAKFFDGGRRIVSAGADSLVRVWTVDEVHKSSVATLRGHQDGISGFSLDPSERWLTTGSLDGTVRLWDIQNVTTKPVRFTPRISGISAVATSPDGQLIAAADGGQRIRIWSRGEPLSAPAVISIVKERGDIRGKGPWGLRFSPDGRWLIAMADGKLRLWRMRVDEQLAMACRMAGRNLDIETWQVHLERTPYHLTCPSYGLHPGWINVADNLAKKGELQQAEALYETARKVDQSITTDFAGRAVRLAVASYLDTARGLARSGQTDAALAVFASARAFDPKHTLDPEAELQGVIKAQAVLKRANDKARAGELDAAILLFREAQALDKSLDIDPERDAKRLVAPLFVARGDAFAKTGEIDKAIVEYERAIAFEAENDLDPKERAQSVRAHALIAQASNVGDEGDLAGATRLFEQALALKPALAIDPVMEGRKSIAKHRAGEARQLVGKGRITEAVTMYRFVRELDPKLFVSGRELNELCWQGAKRSLAKDVLDLCDLAIVKEPDNGLIYDSRGAVRALLNDSRGAIADFNFYVEWAARDGGSSDEVEARKRAIARLQRGFRFKSFRDFEAIGFKP